MNLEKLKCNFKTLYPKSMIVLYCILVPISLLLSTSFLFFFIMALPISIPIITIMQITESIIALIGVIIILTNIIAGWVFTSNIEKKINSAIEKKYEDRGYIHYIRVVVLLYYFI